MDHIGEKSKVILNSILSSGVIEMIIEVGSVKTHNSVSRDYTTTPVDVNIWVAN